jgi:hypothetical protein
MMTLENGVQGMEYSQHLTQWKAAFQQFYGTHSSHHRETVQADVAQVRARLEDGGMEVFCFL